jgi:hypothetical protein
MKLFDEKLDMTRQLVSRGITAQLPRKYVRRFFPWKFQVEGKKRSDFVLTFAEFKELAQYVFEEMQTSEQAYLNQYYKPELEQAMANLYQEQAPEDKEKERKKWERIRELEEGYAERNAGKTSYPIQ